MSFEQSHEGLGIAPPRVAQQVGLGPLGKLGAGRREVQALARDLGYRVALVHGVSSACGWTASNAFGLRGVGLPQSTVPFS